MDGFLKNIFDNFGAESHKKGKKLIPASEDEILKDDLEEEDEEEDCELEDMKAHKSKKSKSKLGQTALAVFKMRE
jgi:hypothetical protein